MILEAETFDRFGYGYDTAVCRAKIVCSCDFCGIKVEKSKIHIKESRKISQYDCCSNNSCKAILSIRKGKTKSLYEKFQKISAQLLKTNPETGERQPDPKDIAWGSDKKLWWDEGCGHEPFEQTVIHRTRQGQGCPKCRCVIISKKNTERALKKGSLATSFQNIAAQLLKLNPKTGERQPDPKDIPWGSDKELWWDDGCEHGPFEQMVNKRTGRGYGCPKCGDIRCGEKHVGRALKRGSLATNFSEIAAQLLKTNPETGERQPDPKNIPYGSRRKYFWDENCGHEPFEQSVCARTGKGSGCPICDASHGEELIAKLLKQKGISFKQEWKPDGLKHKNQLSIDFVIMFKENMIAAIEFQGIQHYKAVNFFGGEEALAENQIRDQIKRDWCRENNIPLLEVHYEWKEIEEELDKFLSRLGIDYGAIVTENPSK
jgi:hypothetical protein